MNRKLENDRKKKYLLELQEQIKEHNESKFQLCDSLIQKALYLENKLDELQKDIDLNGLKIQLQQGSYFIERANPSCAIYDKFLKQYTSIIKQINSVIGNELDESTDLLNFINNV